MSEYVITENGELYHHGVKGMKWGVRKKQENSVNKGYTAKQRKQDRAFYGNRGEKRINKRLNEGYGLRGARHYEAERKERVEKTKKTVKRGVKKTAKVLASVGSFYIADQVFNRGEVTRLVTSVIKNTGRAVASAYASSR